jgi:phosphoenolpyruvate---glycerone phosphotransferase subunit DhaL
MTRPAFDAPLARAWLAAAAAAIERHQGELTELDAAIGDGDHGGNLNRGFAAVLVALEAQAAKAEAAAQDDASGADAAVTPGQVFTTAGSTLISKVGGASGPLYGSALRAIGKTMTATAEERRADPSSSCAGPDGAAILTALHAGLEAVIKLGGAQVGDKTMVDAYTPAVEAFGRELEAGHGLPAAARAAADAAEQGATATIPLVAHKGRASYLGERSAGHQDPGATSTALLFRALADVVGGGVANRD